MAIAVKSIEIGITNVKNRLIKLFMLLKLL